MKSIGIMGGTFDPIHLGHIITAEKVKETFCLDEVVFVPSGNPPHKKGREITAAADRLAMVRLAVEGKNGFSVSTMEIDREGYSYALDTVNAFYELYGTDIHLFFITGADAISEIMSWYKAEELLGKCEFIAASRPGYTLVPDKTIPPALQKRIHRFHETALEISSSEIRSRISQGESVSAMIPYEVETYIRDHHLYKKGAL